MTPYAHEDLHGGWEFKILRSSFMTFREPQKLRAVLDEEARAGWELLEKFDDNRLRLKRPTSARQLDGKLDFDPYRTYVGPSEGARALLVMGAIVGALLVFLILAAGIGGRKPGLIVLPLIFFFALGLAVFRHLARAPRHKNNSPVDLY